MSRTVFAIAYFVVTSPLLSAGEPKVSFDVPALVEARLVDPDNALGRQKIIEVTIPVSTSINHMTRRDDISEFRFDVSWNQSVYPLVDYGPRTQTIAGVQGTIGVEKREESNSGFNFGVESKPTNLAQGSLNADVGRRASSQLSFQEIPRHRLLVASGSIDRGTGAFFRFHRSKTEPLEGGKEVMLVFRVPTNWSKGLLSVRCRAVGSRRVAGVWDEPLLYEKSFVLPVYLQDELAAQEAAIEFIKSEQNLRRVWLTYKQQAMPQGVKAAVSRLLNPEPVVPGRWLEQFVASGSQRLLTQFQNQLSPEVSVAAGKFLQSRSQLKQ